MSTTIDVLLVTILLSVLLSLGSSRMMALVKTMALQGAMVSLVPIFLEQQRLTSDGILFFQLMFLIKAALIPGLLYLAVTRVAIKREVEPLIGYHASLAAGLAFILLAAYLVERMTPSLPGGLFLMMSRTKAITQVIGYLMLENGIYLVGATLTGKAHSLYIVEFGVLLDLLVGVMIMGIILNNINRTFDDVDTAHLEQLKD
jgi:hydrogenase-4 component E